MKSRSSTLPHRITGFQAELLFLPFVSKSSKESIFLKLSTWGLTPGNVTIFFFSFFSLFFSTENNLVSTLQFWLRFCFQVFLLSVWCKFEHFLHALQRHWAQEQHLIHFESFGFLPLLNCETCYDLLWHISGKLGQGFYNGMLLKP